MRALPVAMLLVATVVAQVVVAQQEPAFEELPLRVIAVRPGAVVVVDRGSRDLVEKGDFVVLHPREGGRHQGLVVSVDERSAVVQLEERGRQPNIGTRGVVVIPSARFPEGPLQGPQAPPEHPPWENPDPDWTPELPLLAEVEVLRPDERPTRVFGRTYFSAEQTWIDDERSNSFYRLGLDVRVENPFGEGGGFRYDGEVNYRAVNQPGDPEHHTKLRVDELSYFWGGTRFDPHRQEVGRFLQHGMPEFGTVDGYEYGYRFEDGDSAGASVGYMPERDNDFRTGDDFQIGAWYRWVSDDTERFTASLGAQKTWHDADQDRDLIVAKVQYLPVDGWNFQGTAWVDYYSNDDDYKDSGLEVTQVWAMASRRYDSGDGMSFTYTRQEYPELQRDEFTPIDPAMYNDDPFDRVAWDGWHWLSDDVQLSGGLGAWVDENESGGDVSMAIDVDDLFLPDSLATVRVFGTQGEFVRGYGAGLSYGWATDNGRWELAYQITDYDNRGFDGDFGDILQHWAHVSRDIQLAEDWNLYLSADGLFWDDENAWRLGVYLQKVF